MEDKTRHLPKMGYGGIFCKSRFAKVFPDKRCIHKAPSGRELSPQVTEGECVNSIIPKNIRFAGSFHHFLPEGGFGEMKMTAGTQ